MAAIAIVAIVVAVALVYFFIIRKMSPVEMAKKDVESQTIALLRAMKSISAGNAPTVDINELQQTLQSTQEDVLKKYGLVTIPSITIFELAVSDINKITFKWVKCDKDSDLETCWEKNN